MCRCGCGLNLHSSYFTLTLSIFFFSFFYLSKMCWREHLEVPTLCSSRLQSKLCLINHRAGHGPVTQAAISLVSAPRRWPIHRLQLLHVFLPVLLTPVIPLADGPGPPFVFYLQHKVLCNKGGGWHRFSLHLKTVNWFWLKDLHFWNVRRDCEPFTAFPPTFLYLQSYTL